MSIGVWAKFQRSNKTTKPMKKHQNWLSQFKFFLRFFLSLPPFKAVSLHFVHKHKKFHKKAKKLKNSHEALAGSRILAKFLDPALAPKKSLSFVWLTCGSQILLRNVFTSSSSPVERPVFRDFLSELGFLLNNVVIAFVHKVFLYVWYHRHFLFHALCRQTSF